MRQSRDRRVLLATDLLRISAQLYLEHLQMQLGRLPLSVSCTLRGPILPVEAKCHLQVKVFCRHAPAVQHQGQLSRKATDPYEVGLAALYERNYVKASAQLTDSLRGREEKLAADQKKDQEAVADAAFFLGSSLYGQGKPNEAATAFRRCLQIQPDDVVVLNNLALNLADAGDYTGAEPLFFLALTNAVKILGSAHPFVAIVVTNLAGLYEDKGDYEMAEPLYRRLLAMDEAALGPNHTEVARDLDNLARLLKEKGDNLGAEPLYRQSLAINEKAL